MINNQIYIEHIKKLREKILEILPGLSKEGKPVESSVLEKNLYDSKPFHPITKDDIFTALEILYTRKKINIDIKQEDGRNVFYIKTMPPKILADNPKTIPTEAKVNNPTKINALQKKAPINSVNPFLDIHKAIQECKNNEMRLSALREEAEKNYGKPIEEKIFAKILTGLKGSKVIKMFISAPEESGVVIINRDKIKTM